MCHHFYYTLHKTRKLLRLNLHFKNLLFAPLTPSPLRPGIWRHLKMWKQGLLAFKTDAKTFCLLAPACTKTPHYHPAGWTSLTSGTVTLWDYFTILTHPSKPTHKERQKIMSWHLLTTLACAWFNLSFAYFISLLILWFTKAQHQLKRPLLRLRTPVYIPPIIPFGA